MQARLKNMLSLKRNNNLPGRFLIQVDGTGSFLIMREPTVTVGPISSSVRPDVGLVVDPNATVATIERAEDDYFIKTSQPVSINDSITSNRLLSDGDRLDLAPRCRLTFSIPNAASTTAVLDLTAARLPRADIKRVVLMDQALIMGPAASAHVRVIADDTSVLQVKDGQLRCKTEQPITIGNRPGDANTDLPFDERIQVGSLSFVVTEL